MNAEALFDTDPLHGEEDQALRDVYELLRDADPSGERAGRVFRATFDQLYDGQHTGRYRWDQLYKTEKTHYGTLLEINLRREFDDVLRDGKLLDFSVQGHEVDCKYSQRMGGWMIPPEARNHLLLVAHANDQAAEWTLGLVRASDTYLRTSKNRDGKTQLNPIGNAAIRWLHRPGDLPPNVLLDCEADDIDAIFAEKSGQRRLNELFRRVQNRRIGRNTIATVAQQDDYMKRARANGGSRTALRPEGFIILSGDYSDQQQVAESLRVDVPRPGEMVSARVVPAAPDDGNVALMGGSYWRLADTNDSVTQPAPEFPPAKSKK